MRRASSLNRTWVLVSLFAALTVSACAAGFGPLVKPQAQTAPATGAIRAARYLRELRTFPSGHLDTAEYDRAQEHRRRMPRSRPPVAWAVIASVALFLASLPALALKGNPPLGTFHGWECLWTGWVGVNSGYVAGLANLLYLPALFALGRRRRRVAITLAALFDILALFSFQYVSATLDFSNDPEPEFESLGPGFWLWLSSGNAPLIAALRLR